jgi:hypothetical protein
VIKKQGTSLMGGWEYDKSMLMPIVSSADV